MMGPLAGIRVLDLSQIVSGPMAGAWLSDQGADVLKLEAPAGDPVRSVGVRKGNMSAIFVSVNRGKRGIVLDLKDPATRADFEALLRWADVLIENFRPGALARLGFSWERCAEINPRLIYCAITGFGPDGPYANIRAYDPVVQAASGVAATQADAQGQPSLVQSLVCDKVTALTAAQGITAALFARERSGTGQRVEIAMLDAALAFNWPEGMYNHAFVEPAAPFPDYGTLTRLWPALDGQVSMAAIQDSEFQAMRDALGNPESLADPRYDSMAGRFAHLAALLPAMGAEVAIRTRGELMDGFKATGAVGCTVNSREEVLTDPQVLHNGSIVTVDQGSLGHVRVARHPVRFSATPANDAPGPAPALEG